MKYSSSATSPKTRSAFKYVAASGYTSFTTFDTMPSTEQRRSNSDRSASVLQFNHGATREVDSPAQRATNCRMSASDLLTQIHDMPPKNCQNWVVSKI